MRKSLILPAIALFALPAHTAAADGTSLAVPAKPTFDTSDPVRYGTALARYMDRFDSGWADEYSKSQMTLYDARGDSVRRNITRMVLEGDSGDKSLIRFLGPAEIRGVAALIHEHPTATDDSWLYLPASRRVRRISGANRTASFQGTEFTYEDLSSIVVGKYDWRYLRNTELKVDGKSEPVFVLQATPNYRDTGYEQVHVHLNRNKWRIERMVFFDRAGRKLKTLTNSRWDHMHGRFWRARRLDMTNHQTRKRTVIETGSQFLNLSRYPKKDGSMRKGLTARQFTRQRLEGR